MPRFYKNIVKEAPCFYITGLTLMILTAKYTVNASAKMSAFGNEE